MKCAIKLAPPKTITVDVKKFDLFPVDEIKLSSLNFIQSVPLEQDTINANPADRVAARIYHCLMAGTPEARFEIDTGTTGENGKPIILTGLAGFTAYLNSDPELYGALFEAMREVFPISGFEEKKTE